MKKYKRIIPILLVVLSIGLIGYAFGFFNYSRTGHNNKVIAGSLYLTLNEGVDSINLQNLLPETKEEARARNDNTLTFSVSGKNTSTSKPIHYEIFLNNGTDSDDPEKVRINPKDLVFDLIEIGPNNTETYIIEGTSYTNLSNQKIWVDKVDENTTSEITRTYKLRVWISDHVWISDSDEGADYTSAEFSNAYASVRVGVEGDLEDRYLPLLVTFDDTMIENNTTYVTNVIRNFESENSQDTFGLTITSSNSNVEIEYNNDAVTSNISNELTEIKPSLLIKDYEDKDIVHKITASTSTSQSFTIQNNKKVTFKLYLTTVNGEADQTDLHYSLTKNGIAFQQLVKHVEVLGNKEVVIPVIDYVDRVATYNGQAVTLSNVTVVNSDNSEYNGVVSYTYYKGSLCNGQTLNSAPVDAGSYSVLIQAPSGTTAPDGEECAKITINKQSITCPDSSPSYVYSGSEMNSGITCPTGSTADGQTTGTTVGTYTQTCEADNNHNFASSCTPSWSITQLACAAPTNVSISSAGVITWTPSSNCSSAQHQLKIANGSYANAVSGVNKKSDIISTAGTRTVYVKVLAPNANYTDSSAGTGSTNVLTVTLTAGTGISAVTGAGKYITGETVTLGATVSSGYNWSKWVYTNGGADWSTTKAYSHTISADWSLTARATQITYTKKTYNCSVGNYRAGSPEYIAGTSCTVSRTKQQADSGNLGTYQTCTLITSTVCPNAQNGQVANCWKRITYTRASCATWKSSPKTTETGQTSCTPSTTAYTKITCDPE